MGYSGPEHSPTDRFGPFGSSLFLKFFPINLQTQRLLTLKTPVGDSAGLRMIVPRKQNALRRMIWEKTCFTTKNDTPTAFLYLSYDERDSNLICLLALIQSKLDQQQLLPFPVWAERINNNREMSGKIQLQRHVDLTSAVMIIVGAIVGSGIYISPKGTLQPF